MNMKDITKILSKTHLKDQFKKNAGKETTFLWNHVYEAVGSLPHVL
jgi:hypothetical protein